MKQETDCKVEDTLDEFSKPNAIGECKSVRLATVRKSKMGIRGDDKSSKPSNLKRVICGTSLQTAFRIAWQTYGYYSASVINPSVTRCRFRTVDSKI